MADNAHTIDIHDNRTVVGLLRAGDEKCFDALFRRYYKPLCTYATRFVPPVRAEELVQDTLMWVWENRTSLIPEMPLKSLLFTIVKNKSLNSASRDTLKTASSASWPNATKRRSTTPISTSRVNWCSG